MLLLFSRHVFASRESNNSIFATLKKKKKVKHKLIFFYSLKILEEVPDSRLKIRLQFHLSQKLGDESRINEYHSQLVDVVEDQLSLASIHYLRAHYNEAIDIYKRILQVEANRYAHF